jgi:universal stress protein A
MLNLYKKIVVALELNDQSDTLLLDKVQEFLKQGVEVYLVHAVEHMSSYGAAYGVSAGIDIEAVLLEEAQKIMRSVGKQLGIQESHLIVHIGPAKFVILDEANKESADLIIIGSHGRHGIRLLLGSTANAVLHNAKCDVLAVRVQDD